MAGTYNSEVQKKNKKVKLEAHFSQHIFALLKAQMYCTQYIGTDENGKVTAICKFENIPVNFSATP